MKRPEHPCGIAFWLVLAVAVGFRGAVMLAQPESLTHDIDAYLGLAEQLADGHGFADPQTDRPTAYRPPLYPLLLAGFQYVDAGTIGLIVLHLLASAATVWLTVRTGLRLGLSPGGSVAAGAVIAVDPLLVQYAARPMTETIATFLAACLLWLASRSTTEESHSVAVPISLGVIFGLAALCRPTFWVYGMLAVIVWVWRRFKSRPAATGGSGFAVLAAGVVVLPWVLRNVIVFELPILTTTHGGYTLLLGNNPVFAREVVHGPPGAVWGGESLTRWQASLEVRMQRAGVSDTEPARDRWMREQAFTFIQSEPITFLHACWLRFRRFWGMSPPASGLAAVHHLWLRVTGSQSAADTLTAAVAWGVRGFYGVIFVAAVFGGMRIRRSAWTNWRPAALLVLSFCIVHLVYWSNARMRAPILPAVALFAAAGVFGPNWRSDAEPITGLSEH